MKDHIKEKIADAKKFEQIMFAADDYMDYYNNERYVWDLTCLSSNEYYQFVATERHPLEIPHPLNSPVIKNRPEELAGRRIRMQGNLLMINAAKYQRKRLSQTAYECNSTY